MPTKWKAKIKIKMKKFFIVALLGITSLIYSQKTHHEGIWLAYTGQFKFSNRVGVHVEAQNRNYGLFETNIQNLYRAGLNFYVAPQTSLTVGYALVDTYNSGFGEYFKEDRIWEQLQFYHDAITDNSTMLHRFRLEQRWVESLALNEMVYQNRLRYMNRMLIHLAELKNEKSIYGVVQNELFIPLGENKITTNFLDQNRLTLGAGINFNNKTRIELGYLNQFLNPFSDHEIINHNLSLAVFQSLNLMAKKAE
jgi:hypothetical protein